MLEYNYSGRLSSSLLLMLLSCFFVFAFIFLFFLGYGIIAKITVNLSVVGTCHLASLMEKILELMAKASQLMAMLDC